MKNRVQDRMPFKNEDFLSVDKVFIRNFIIFMVILLACAGSLSVSLISGDRDLEKTDKILLHAHDVIAEAEQLSTMVEGMLASQRGYILSGEDHFLQEYEYKKGLVSNHIAMLSELMADNPSQQSRLDEIRNYFTDFSKELENRAEVIRPATNSILLKNVENIDNLRNNIIRINKTILDEEYTFLNRRFNELDHQKTRYLNTLLISVVIGTVLLLIFNGFLLHAQRKRTRAEASLKDSEERFVLAVEGTEDGIFDWNLRTNEIFYSGRFFSMLGYERPAGIGKLEDAFELVHPDDHDAVKEYVDKYLDGELSEYHQEFRMKHQSGRWVWIQSRAKALFDRNGKAIRMVGAHTDITHTVKTKERLEAEKHAAQEANQAKSEFLAHMSHEIRTPLTTINGIAEILERQCDTLTEKQAKLVHTLLSSASSLKDLVNDILDFSKIESGELELDEEAFDLDGLFENVISMMALKASEKGISFVFDYKNLEGLTFYGDPKRIRQILVNLINNAIKFTDRGGVNIQSEIEERQGTEFLRIDVTDTGIGINSEDFDLVFERFKQADSSVSRKYGGTGLGLPISMNLARLMGGEIFLNSETGKGSTFTLLLPVRHSEKKVDRPHNTKELDKKLQDKIRSTLHKESKILMVEDYEGNIVVLGHILEEMGINYDVARTGLEAVNFWSENYYDMILMDVQMPEMDGFSATQEIRLKESQNKLPHTPVIGMTAHALMGDKDKCIEAGMDAYLPKPLVEADLKREILRFMEKKKAA